MSTGFKDKHEVYDFYTQKIYELHLSEKENRVDEILKILDDYNLGGQLDVIIKLIR